MKRILWLALVLSACKTGLYSGESNLDAGQPVGNLADLGSVHDASKPVDLGHSDLSLVALDASQAIDLTAPSADLAESADLTMVGGNTGQDVGTADDLAPSADLTPTIEQDLDTVPDLIQSPDFASLDLKASVDLGQIIVIVPSVDLRSAVDLALAPAEDLATSPDLTAPPEDLAAPALDLATRLDLAASPADLAESLDLVTLPKDLTVSPDIATSSVDLASPANDLAIAQGSLTVTLSSRVVSRSLDATTTSYASVASIAFDFTNSSSLHVAVPWFAVSGSASIDGNAFSPGDLSSVIASCKFVDEMGPSPGYSFVDKNGGMMFPNTALIVPPHSTRTLIGNCDQNGGLPMGVTKESFALGIKSASDIVAYDTSYGNNVVATIDPAVAQNADTTNQSVVITFFSNPVTPDTTPPLITLYGDNPATVFLGSNYTDPGASAFDAVDGMVPVVVGGFVDPNTVGSYTIIYTATDLSGNTASTTRTVNVIPPFCGTVTMNGTTVEAYGRVTVSWANDTPQGAASPGAQEIIGKVVLYADGNLNCEDVEVDRFILNFYSAFAFGPLSIRKNLFNGPTIYTTPAVASGASVLAVDLVPGDLDIASGNSVTLYIVADTRAARTTDYLSIRMNGPITYTTLTTGSKYTTFNNDLPIVYKTFTY